MGSIGGPSLLAFDGARGPSAGLIDSLEKGSSFLGQFGPGLLAEIAGTLHAHRLVDVLAIDNALVVGGWPQVTHSGDILLHDLRRCTTWSNW